MGVLLIMLALASPSLGMVCSGCSIVPEVGHGWYVVMIENRSNQAVVVTLLGDDILMRPCSLRKDLARSGPRYGVPLQVQVKNQGGDVIAAWTVNDCRGAGGGVCDLRIRFPLNDAGECPEDTRREYALVIRNQQGQDIDVTADGTHLGVVPGRGGERRFGSVPGDWEAMGELELRDSEGRLMEHIVDYAIGGEPVDYNLGQTPVVRLVLNRGAPRR